MTMIRIQSADEMLVGRDVFIVAVFAEQPYPQVVPSVQEALDLWLSMVPLERLEWARVGANSTSYTRFSTTVVRRCRAELDLARVSGKDVGFFTLRGGEDPNNPSYAFTFSGGKPSPRVPARTPVVELRFPSELPEEFGLEAFVDWVRRVGESLPFRSGYASPALSRGWEDKAHIREAGRHLVPIAFRHPGYDLPENLSAASFMGVTQCRGARWISLLGPKLVVALGGTESLRAKLDPRVAMVPVGDGLLLRAGERPELGDVNRGDAAPLLRSVAAALEPVTFFDEDLHTLGSLFGGDEERVRLWERRLLD
jgi:hypothetical protein